jgi:putative toxin-antitoxin system antitoxin component (TIGR02293 family)
MKAATKPKPVPPKKKKNSSPRTALAPPTKLSRSAAKKPARSNQKKSGAGLTGLDFGEFEALRKQLDLSLEELSGRLGLSETAIAQRKASGRLTNDESGKVVCFARLLGHAMYLFGSLNEARQWLKTPQRGLHGAVPLDYAGTEFGAREVENLLSQLDRDRSA